MSRIKKIFLLLFPVLFLVFLAHFATLGQEPVKSLSLEDAITATLSNNKSLQEVTMDENMATLHYRQTAAVYLPQVNVSYTAVSTNNPLNAFGFRLEQQSIQAADFNPDLLNHPAATPDYTTKLELRQPLVNMDMIYLRKAAAKQILVYQFKSQRTREYVIFEVQKAYKQLQLAYDAEAVLKEEWQNTREIYRFTEDHYKQGLLPKSDLLNVQVQVETLESNLLKAKSNIQNASDYLNMLMGLPMGICYSTTSKADEEKEAVDTAAFLSSTRADFEAMQKVIEAKELMITSGKNSLLPRLNAFGSYQFNDNRMLGFAANSYLAGIQLSWDIFKGNSTKNSILSQTLERNQLRLQLAEQKEQGNLELNKTKRALADAQKEISQHQLAIEQAMESLRILQNRYNQGLVNTLELMLASNQLSTQKLSLAQARFNQQVNKAYLQFLTATTNK